MIDNFCVYLTNKIRKKMPEIDNERAEIIQYGIELIFGEVPKLIITLIISAILNVFWYTLAAFFLILPYKIVAGGVHLKTHLGCFLMTNLVYCGNALLSVNVILPNNIKIIFIALNFILGIVFISKYAPADTVNQPILRKKERKIKKILSYIFLIINLIIAFFIPNSTISNILIFGTFVQTISITRVVYFLAKNEYGYENYIKEKELQQI